MGWVPGRLRSWIPSLKEPDETWGGLLSWRLWGNWETLLWLVILVVRSVQQIGIEESIPKTNTTTTSVHTSSHLGQLCVFPNPECCPRKAITSSPTPSTKYVNSLAYEIQTQRDIYLLLESISQHTSFAYDCKYPDNRLFHLSLGLQAQFAIFLSFNIFSCNTVLEVLLDHRPSSRVSYWTDRWINKLQRSDLFWHNHLTLRAKKTLILLFGSSCLNHAPDPVFATGLSQLLQLHHHLRWVQCLHEWLLASQSPHLLTSHSLFLYSTNFPTVTP